MGIAISQFGVFLSLREKIRDKKILPIEVQLPPKHTELVAFHKNFPELLSKSDLNLSKNLSNTLHDTLNPSGNISSFIILFKLFCI